LKHIIGEITPESLCIQVFWIWYGWQLAMLTI
jgi:hypothetical protein